MSTASPPKRRPCPHTHKHKHTHTTTTTTTTTTTLFFFLAALLLPTTTHSTQTSSYRRLHHHHPRSSSTLSFSILPPIFQRRNNDAPSPPSSSSSPPPQQPATPEPPLADLGFSFSPAGLLFPYHLGVASYLRERRIITNNTPLGGSSAGALVAALVGCDLNIKTALKACYAINEQWSGALSIAQGGFNFNIGGGTNNEEGGSATVSASMSNGKSLKALLHDVLDEVLPKDAHLRLNNRAGRVTVGVTELAWSGFRPTFFLRPKAIHTFTSREDLIECLLASCNVPILFAGVPYLNCRGSLAIDGFFSVPTHRFGCPYIPSERTVLVSPFPATTVTRGPGGPSAEEARVIEWLSPDLDLAAAAAAATASGATANNGGGGEVVVTRAGMRQLLRDAWSSNPRESVERYFELGRKDAQLWLETSEFAARKRGGRGRGQPLGTGLF